MPPFKVVPFFKKAPQKKKKKRLGLHVREPAPKQRPRVWKPPRIEFPEDRVITSILARRPEVRKEKSLEQERKKRRES